MARRGGLTGWRGAAPGEGALAAAPCAPSPSQLVQRRHAFRRALLERVRPVHDAFVRKACPDAPARPKSLGGPPSDNWDARFDVEAWSAPPNPPNPPNPPCASGARG
jgi:hypothetical protein